MHFYLSIYLLFKAKLYFPLKIRGKKNNYKKITAGKKKKKTGKQQQQKTVLFPHFLVIISVVFSYFFLNSFHPPFLMSVVLAVVAVVVATVFVFLVFPIMRMNHHLSKFPSMDGGLPFLGHALRLAGPAPWTTMAEWSFSPDRNGVGSSSAKKRSEGSFTTSGGVAAPNGANRMVVFNVAGMRVLYINHPTLLKRVLLTKQRVYRKAVDAAYKHFLCLLGTGLVTSEDEQWRKGRLLLSHALRIDILEDIPTMTMRAVTRIMNKLQNALIPTSGVEPWLDLCEEFRHMTLQVIGESALSLSPDETDKIFPALYLPIVHECNRRVWEPWRAYMPWLKGSRTRNKCLKELNKVIESFIINRWENKEEFLKKNKPDILALCMNQIQDMNPHTVLELRDDAKTMLLAGHETSAALLTWATYELIRHPEVYAKVREEGKVLFDPARCKESIDTPWGRRGVPTADDVRNLVWTPAVLRETLRLHSVVPLVMRYASKDDQLLPEDTGLPYPVTVPAGCTVAVGIQAVHHNPLFWEEPDTFRVERFYQAEIANDTNAMRREEEPKADAEGGEVHGGRSEAKGKPVYERQIDPYAYIPFINGPRNCLGQHLAMIETQVTLTYLILNWDLFLYKDPTKPPSPQWEDEMGRHHDYIIPQVPHEGLNVWGKPNMNAY